MKYYIPKGKRIHRSNNETANAINRT